jgi:DNA-binding transcriptional ArsR family regulator
MSQSDTSALSQDVVFDLLSSPRRRFVLYYLRQEGAPVELRELADEVAAWENDMDVEELTSQQRKRVYVSLYQTHIPKLDEAGIIEYDQDSGMVALADRADELGSYLSSNDETLPWQMYYLAVAVAGALLYSLVAFDVAVFAAVPEYVAGIAIIVAFGLSAVAHYLYNRYHEPEIDADLVSMDR